jgi:hypothetical protein
MTHTQLFTAANAVCLWLKSFMILMHWRTLGESELCENHMAWRIMSNALWLASTLTSCVSVGVDVGVVCDGSGPLVWEDSGVDVDDIGGGDVVVGLVSPC